MDRRKLLQSTERSRVDDAEPIPISDQKLGRLRYVRRGIGWFGRGLRLSVLAVGFVVLALSGLVAALDFLWVTEQDVAYRGQHPDSRACKDQRQFAAILAREKYDDVVQFGKTSTGERKAAEDDGRIGKALGCVVQEHVIPAKPGNAWPDGKPVLDVHYYLGFVEFKEDGESYPLRMDAQEVAPGRFPTTASRSAEGPPGAAHGGTQVELRDRLRPWLAGRRTRRRFERRRFANIRRSRGCFPGGTLRRDWKILRHGGDRDLSRLARRLAR